MAGLYCPKCGAELKVNGAGELECSAGDMQLSSALNLRLTECYITKVREPASSPLSSSIGGVWFCPGCACAIPEESPGNLRCPNCQKQLAEFVHALVEFHPHRGPKGD